MSKIEHYKGYIITIENDEYAEAPNIWDNDEVFLVYSHRDFDIEVIYPMTSTSTTTVTFFTLSTALTLESGERRDFSVTV